MSHSLVSFFLLAALVVAPAAPASPAGGGPFFQEKEKGKKKADEKKGSAPERQQAPGRDLEAWGVLKDVKGSAGFFTLDYTKIEGRKASKHSAFVKVPDDAEFYTDKSIRATDLKEGDTVWLLGRPVERESPSPAGFTGMDRQFQNVSAIVKGEGLRVHRAYKDARDPNLAWCEATVAKAGPSIQVKYDGNTYKVVMGKAAPVLLREKSGDAKALKSGIQAEVSADKSEEKPETKSAPDAKKDSFLAKKVVFLDKRLTATLYPMLLE